ncbi:MAG: hypothetical protein B6226_05160 [Candidatus Cloacimonetes bacterium 4572_65]|nr:MAG: hypothetical protein B6226_05160 [Candidatus Cloacimonetes bacterium 4572_65]
MKKSLLINVVVILAIIIFVNMLSVTMFKRLDFSKGKLYSLSDTSKETVKAIDDRIVIKAYFSENLPPQYADARRYTEDLLAEYQVYSKGKLRFEFIDPASAEDLKAEATKNMIHPVQMQINENDKMEIREIYMGLAFLYQGKSETIPLVQKTQGLEYDITLKLKNLVSDEQKKVAVFKPESIQRDMFGRPKDNYGTLNALINENYTMEDVDLESPIDSSIRTMLVTGINDSLTTNQLYNLDQFIMNGGSVAFYQDRVKASVQTQQAEEINSNIFDFLAGYGIKVHSNVVADAECGQVNISRRQGFFTTQTPVKYPFIPILTNFNMENSIVKNIDVMTLIFASELDTTYVAEGINFQPLIYTSKHSKRIGAPRFDIAINSYMNKDLNVMLNEGPACVAGVYSGSFKSNFAGNSNFPNGKNESVGSHIIYVADTDILLDNAGAGTKTNMEFALNSLDYISGDASLIDLRSRGTEYKPLKADITAKQRKMIKWTNILLPSFILMLVGLVVSRVYANKKKMLEAMYE